MSPRRIARIAAIAVSGVLVAAALAAAALFVVVHSEAGRAWIASGIAGQLSTPGATVEIGRLAPGLPRKIDLEDVTVRDREGPFAHVARIEIDWHPLALLSGELHVSRIEASGATLTRSPVTAPEAESAPVALPRLPFDLVIDRFVVTDATVSAAVLGQQASFRAEGSLATRGAEKMGLELALTRTDGGESRADVKALYFPPRNRLTLQAEVHEEAGGLLAYLAGVPDLPAIDLSLSGDGPLEHWNGKLALKAGKDGRLDADMAIARAARAGAYTIGIDGSADAGTLLTGPAPALLKGPIAFKLDATADVSGRVEIASATIANAAGRLESSGRVDVAAGTVDLGVTVEPADKGALDRLIAPATVSQARIEAAIKGPMLQPEIKLHLTAGTVKTEAVTLTGVEARLDLTPDRPLDRAGARFAVTGSGNTAGISTSDETVAAVLRAPLSWTLSGTIDPRARIVTASRFAMTANGLSLEGSGTVHLATSEADAALSFGLDDIAALSERLGAPMKGRARGQAHVRLAGGPAIHAVVGGEVTRFASGNTLLDAMSGDTLAFAGDIDYGPEAGLHVTDATLDGRNAHLTAQAQLLDGFAHVKGEASLRVPDAGVLAPGPDFAPAGAAALSVTFGGALRNPDVAGRVTLARARAANLSLEALEGAFTVSDAAGAPKGHAEASATVASERLSVATDFLWQDGRIRLSGLDAEGAGVRAQGSLDVPIDGRPLDGTIEANAASIARLARLAGIEADGAAHARVALLASGQAQAANVEADATDLSANLDGRALAVGGARLEAKIGDIWRAPEGTGSLTAERIASGAATVTNVSVSAAGRPEAANFKLSAAGAVAETPVSIEGEGVLSSKEQILALDVARLQGKAADFAFALKRPAHVETSGPGSGRADAAVSIGRGTLAVVAEMSPERVEAKAQAEKLPLSLLGLAWPGTPIGGTADGTIDIAGPPANPEGTLKLSAADVRLGRDTGLPALTGELSGDWRGNRLALTGLVKGFGRADAKLTADVPLRLSVSPLTLDLPQDEPFAATLSWAGEVRPLWDLVAFEDQLTGKAALTLDAKGTMAKPEIRGQMTLESGEYENFYSGTLLQDVHARVDADAGRVVLSEFGATDGADGRIRADGSLALDPARDFPFTVKVGIEKAKLVRRDDIDASGSGDMTVSGTLSDILIAGRLTTETVNWYLPSQLPPEVVDLPVVTTGGPAGAAPPAAPKAGPAVRLDLEIDLPKRVFVRGRGLDSEWAGRLRLTGPADKPAIEGKIGVVRGQFQFVGKTFDLKSGSVTFPGGLAAEPMLDIEAQHSETGLTVTARITGRVSKVSIALSSQPPYPQDEILSRLLFGKALNKISAVEAVQVASAVSQLSGAGAGAGDLLSLARNFLGVDVLRVETPAGGGAAETRLEAGKYVRRDVYLGVAQGTAPGSAQVNVDVEVTPNISVESGVGQQGTSNVGIKFKWDY